MLQKDELEKILQDIKQTNNADLQYKLGMHYKMLNSNRRDSYSYYGDSDEIQWLTRAAQQKHPAAAKELLVSLWKHHKSLGGLL